MNMKRLLILISLLAGVANAGEQKPAAGDRCDEAQPTRLYMDVANSRVLLCKKGALAAASPQELAAIGDGVKATAAATRQAIELLKKEAKPVTVGQTLKDPGGCLYGITYRKGRLELIQIQDEQKRPVCGA